jgi:hypothetical protein
MPLKYYIPLFFMLLSIPTFSQVRVLSQIAEVDAYAQLWEMQLSASTLSDQKIIIDITIEQEVETHGHVSLLFYAKSPILNMNGGMRQIRFSDIQTPNMVVNKLTSVSQMGKYVYKIEVINVQNNQVLDRLSKEIVLKSAFFSSMALKNEASKSENSSRNKSELSGNLIGQKFPSTGTYVDNLYPSNVFRGDLRLKTEIQEVPINAEGGYSNEAINLGQPSFRFGIHVDQAALKQRLIKEVLKHLSQTTDNADSLKKMVIDKAYPKAKAWKQKLESVNYDSIRRSLDQLNDYKQILENPAFEKNRQELMGLKKQYHVDDIQDMANRQDISTEVKNRIQNLESFQAGYTRIQAQADVLKTKEQDLKKYEKTYQELQRLEHTDINTLLSDDRVLSKMNQLTGGKTSKLLNVLHSIKDFNVGTTYPLFSQQTLSGGRLDGLDISIKNNKNTYLRFIGGRFLGQYIGIQDTNRQNVSPTYAAGLKIGMGEPSEMHLHFTYLTFKKRDAFNPTGNTPAFENDVCGLDFMLATPNKKWQVSGEVNLSLYNPDKFLPRVISTSSSYNEDFFLIKKREGFQKDVSFKSSFKRRLFKDKTRLSGYFDQVGQGYKSVGAPFLLSNVLRYEGRLNQSLFKDKLQAAVYYRKDFDNITPLRYDYRQYSIITDYGINLQFQADKLPYIIVNISPYKQTGLTDTISNNAKGLMYQLSSGYNWTIKKAQLNTQTSFIYQKFESNYLQGITELLTITGTQSIVTKHLIVNALYNYSPPQNLNGIVKDKSIMGEISAGMIVKKTQMRLGYQHFDLYGEHKRESFYINGFISILKQYNLDLTVQKNNYINKGAKSNDWTGAIKTSFFIR